MESGSWEDNFRDRARLAHRLLESLEEDEAVDADEVDRAWQAEVERRVAEFDAGGVELMPAEDVIGEARARLRRK